MLSRYLSLIWSVFDTVFDWCTLGFSAFGINFSSLVLGMLCVTLIIGYLLSPYLHNPIPSASNLAARREARSYRKAQAANREEMKRESRRRYEETSKRTAEYRKAILSTRRPR